MHDQMRPRITTVLLLLIVAAVGCRKSAESEPPATIETFDKEMEKLDASILPGMTRSNVSTLMDNPVTHTMDTNYGPYSNWVTVAYTWPDMGQQKPMTNGFVVVYSNDTVIQKFPILRDKD